MCWSIQLLLRETLCCSCISVRFEAEYDPRPVRRAMQSNPWFPVVVCVLYLVSIYGGRQYFANRPAWKWRIVLAIWNLTLSVFSTIGFIKTLPAILHNTYSLSLEENLCNDPEGMFMSGSTGLWVHLFVFSKFP